MVHRRKKTDSPIHACEVYGEMLPTALLFSDRRTAPLSKYTSQHLQPISCKLRIDNSFPIVLRDRSRIGLLENYCRSAMDGLKCVRFLLIQPNFHPSMGSFKFRCISLPGEQLVHIVVNSCTRVYAGIWVQSVCMHACVYPSTHIQLYIEPLISMGGHMQHLWLRG